MADAQDVGLNFPRLMSKVGMASMMNQWSPKASAFGRLFGAGIEFRHYNFHEVALDLTNSWLEAHDSTFTGGAAWASASGLGGLIQTTTGTTSGAVSNLYGKAMWNGNQGCGLAARVKINTNTNHRFEIGFIDALTTKTSAAINDIDTPSFNTGVGDAALVACDTGQTLTTMALATVGSTPYSAAKNLLGTRQFVSATYVWVVVQCMSQAADNVYASILNAAGDQILDQVSTGAGAIAGATLLLPWFGVGNKTGGTSTRIWNIDDIMIWQDKI